MKLINALTGECHGYIVKDPLSRNPLKTPAIIYVSKKYWGILRSISKAIERLIQSYELAFGPITDNQELSEALEDFTAGIFTLTAYQQVRGESPEVESTANDIAVLSKWIQCILRDQIEAPILESALEDIGANTRAGLVCFHLSLFMAFTYEFVLEEVTVALHNQYLEHFYHMLMCEQGAEN